MIQSLSQLKDTIKKCQGIWAWVGQRGIDAFTILGFVPVETVFCCDYGEDYSNLWQSESLFSVEKNLGRRENWGNQDLEKLWEGETRELIDRYAEKVKGPINTICYRSIGFLEKDKRFRVLAPPVALKNMFDDKLRQLDLFAKLEIKTPPTLVTQLDETSFNEASDMLDGSFVVQPPIGSSGENTYIINNNDDFDRAKEVLGPDQRVKVSKFMPGPSLNGHCVVLHTREGFSAIATCPSVQIVGARDCTNRAEIYCGNDFTAAGRVSSEVREKICTIIEKVGLYMGLKGFLGVFGMDFLLVGDDVLALELNPRFQGSTMLLSLMQLERKEVPLAALHVMQFMDRVDEFSQEFLAELRKMYRIPYTGAHLIVHNLEEKSCNAEHGLKSGIHTLEDNELQMVRSGMTYCDVEHPHEWCVLGNLPLPETEICQHARLAMIHTSKSLLDRDLQQLASTSVSFVSRIQQSFKMIPY